MLREPIAHKPKKPRDKRKTPKPGQRISSMENFLSMIFGTIRA